MNEIKPSEALFVRCILPHCKRMGAVWLKNTKIIRERCRDQKIKGKLNGINKLKERYNDSMDKDSDLVAMVTVLRKLYKEVHTPSVMSLIRCWLSLTEDDNDSVCVFTRGDSRGRMRRIDGGKGADKVWRLDTLVAMLYHGLPLTSADSSLVHHSCKHDLCVRPQHLRIRLSSLAVVLVLKALSQAGYSIKKNDSFSDRQDEFVDISGPFSIQKLDILRHEFIKSGEIENYKLASSPDDYFILEQNPSLKKYYMVQSKKVSSPVPDNKVTSPNVYKRHLLFRLIENSKQDKLNIIAQKVAEDLETRTTKTTNQSNSIQFSEPIMQNSNKRISLCDNLSLRNKTRKIMIQSENTAQCSVVTQAMDGEDTELIEIMTAQKPKKKIDWMDSMLCELSQSPSRSVLDKLVKDIIRSGSGSDKESRDSKMMGDGKLWHYNKNDADDTNYELFDSLNTMRSNSKSDIYFKMTPNIFSPISDTEEIQAAE